MKRRHNPPLAQVRYQTRALREVGRHDAKQMRIVHATRRHDGKANQARITQRRKRVVVVIPRCKTIVVDNIGALELRIEVRRVYIGG